MLATRAWGDTMASRAVDHSVQAQTMEMTHQVACQRVLAHAAHGVPVQRVAGPSARVVLGHLYRPAGGVPTVLWHNSVSLSAVDQGDANA